MVNRIQAVVISGTHVSGVAVSMDRRAWQPKRPCPLALDAFPTVAGTGVSAAGCRP
jgi:hypothetical protein